MAENKKEEKDKKEESKEETSKHGLSKETLERILEDKKPRKEIKPIEESDSIISNEELKLQSEQLRNKEKFEEETAIRNPPRPIFLERELEEEFSPSSNNQRSENNSSEYITRQRNQNKKEDKYINYETTSSTRNQKPEEISKSWSKPFQNKGASFISAHPELNNQKQQYETYFTPRKLSDDEMKDLSKNRDSLDFNNSEKNMYYND